jgi:hypothetical protein
MMFEKERKTGYSSVLLIAMQMGREREKSHVT